MQNTTNMFCLVKFKFHFIFIFLVWTRNLDAATQQCHPGTGRCFWLVDTEGLSWADARAACQEDGRDLAVMETEELNNYVKDTFR